MSVEGPARLGISVSGALALLISAASAWWISRSVIQPLRDALMLSQKITAGDLTVRYEVKRTDEFGQLMTALSRMKSGCRS